MHSRRSGCARWDEAGQAGRNVRQPCRASPYNAKQPRAARVWLKAAAEPQMITDLGWRR